MSGCCRDYVGFLRRVVGPGLNCRSECALEQSRTTQPGTLFCCVQEVITSPAARLFTQGLRPDQVRGPRRSPDSAPSRSAIEDELDLEYLVYGLFERPDRPDGAFLSKRWVSLDDLLGKGGYGNLKAKINKWEASKAARAKAAV